MVDFSLVRSKSAIHSSRARFIDEPCNSFDDAIDLGLLSSSIQISNHVDIFDDCDFYKLTRDQTGTVVATLGSLSNNANLYLYDSNRNLIASSGKDGTDLEAIIEPLLEGTFFLLVQNAATGGTDYQLGLTV